MEKDKLTIKQMNDFLSQLRNVIISKAWRGYGNVIFFETGALNQDGQGKHTISSGFDWLIEFKDEKIESSEEDRSKIDTFLLKLELSKLNTISITDDNLLFNFSDFKSSILTDSLKNTDWSISNNVKKNFLSAKDGSFILEKES